jgi:hypothetical protein
MAVGLIWYRYANQPTTQQLATLQLSLATTSRGQNQSVEQVKLPLPPAGLRVTLNLPETETLALYRLELVDGDGKATPLGEKAAVGRTLVVDISPHLLPAGSYALRIYAVVDSGERRISGNYYFDTIN